MKIKDQKKFAYLWLVIGAVLWVLFSVTNIGDYKSGLLCGMASCLMVVGILRLLKLRRIEKNPDKAADYEVSLTDERIGFIANKARAMTFYISIFLQLGAGLFCTFVLNNQLLSMVFCYLTCIQCFLYVGLYHFYNKRY